MAKGKAKPRKRTAKPIRIGNVSLSDGSLLEFEWRKDADGFDMALVWGDDTILIPLKAWLELTRSATSLMTDLLDASCVERKCHVEPTIKNDIMFR